MEKKYLVRFFNNDDSLAMQYVVHSLDDAFKITDYYSERNYKVKVVLLDESE